MFNRGGFPGQRPMGHGPMNQPGMNHPGMNMAGMNMSGMNMSAMGMSPMNQPGMNLSSMNQPGMNLSSMNQPNMNLSSMNQPNMNLSPMNQPSMNLPSMNQPGMNLSPMNQPNLNISSMNQPNMNLPSMNHPGMNHQRMGHPGPMAHPNIGLSGMNQPNMNLNRMNHPGMNQGGGMGFHQEMKNQAFGMRPMENTGSYGGGNTDIGIKGMPIRSPVNAPSERHMGPQVLPQRFPSPNVPVHQGQPRMPSQNQEIPSIVNRVLTHSSDRMNMKPKAPLQEPAHLVKEKQWDNLNVFGNMRQEMGIKPLQTGSSTLGQASNAQNRYTNESASSILESFGLSNEDLEELSRYPDDQLTPSNMPGILRDIRLRKMNRTASGPDQAAGRRPGSEALPSKVIDYGHSSKYQFTDSANSARSYEAPRNEQKNPPVPKESTTPSNTKPETSSDKGMDNKIPTISGSRKPSWSTSKTDRSNNKTLVGEETKPPVEVSVTLSNVEKSMIPIKTESNVISDGTAPGKADLPQAVQVVPSVGQVPYQKPTETPSAGKGSWVPVLSQDEAQKMKRLPTPSMMNDYYAASPRIFPHICSLCNVECRHLKDWIKHQNNSSHIESCRNLRQQNEGKKDDAAPKTSKSKSTSPRRSRRSGSRHRSRKSRSRSPRSSGRRSRSRSPRRSRQSPRRSRSPRRGPRSPRSRSPRRYRRSSHSNSPDKRAVDAAVQSFIEATKKIGEKGKSAKQSNIGKKLPQKLSASSVKSKKPASNAPTPKKSGSNTSKPGSTSSSSSSSKKPGNSSNSSTARKPTSTSSAAKKPTAGNSNHKKPVVSTGAKKTTTSASSGKKPPSKPSTETSKEAFNPLNKFTSKNSSGKIIHVTNLPDSGYTDQDILKIVQPFGKVCDILIVRSKNEAFMETNFREAAAAAVKFSESTPVIINNQRITLSLAGQGKKAAKSAEKGGKLKEEPPKASAKTAAPAKEEKGTKQPEKHKHDIEVPPGYVKRYMLDEPPLKQNEKCVILISNLPEVQYTVEEITNLAKPFGCVNDVLLIANHRKAYLELASRNSVDSMIKYYNVFPTYLSGNLLSICIASRYKDLKDEDLIFAELIEQSSYKITPTIYEKFVYLTDLPEKDVDDFAIIRVGLRFGKVEHHVYLSNKKKAILHLHTASAAKAMHSFLNQYPCSIGEKIVQCSLPIKTALGEDEYITYIEEDKPSEEKPAESKDPKQEKSSQLGDIEGGAAPSSPGGLSEMDVVSSEGDVVPAAKDDEETDESSAQASSVAISPGAAPACSTFVATEDDDDEEEAAEAPEAPDTSPMCIQAEPDTHLHEPYPVSHGQVSEELDVLVSVESDEEEPEEEHPFIPDTKQDPHVLPNKPLNTETSSEEGPSDSAASEGKEATRDDAQKVITEPSLLQKSGDEGNQTSEVGEGCSTDIVQAESSDMQDTKEATLNPTVGADVFPSKTEEKKDSQGKTNGDEVSEEKPKPVEEKPANHAAVKGKDESAVPEMSSSSVTRTTKYNAQKGEISVTVTLESQKTKLAESRRRRSRERGLSGHDSSIPRTNSNRSSPADSASSHTKSSSSFSQKKTSGKYTSSQPERESKDMSRPRDREARPSSRKDERTRGSSSSRYTRSSKSNTRSPRSKEEEEETFPFNLDEFVTVDEIVEEQVDTKKRIEEKERTDATRKGKRKENYPPPTEMKKSRVASTDSPSFVTLDEVGDEEENAGTQENPADQTTQSLVTLDEVHAEDIPPGSTKQEQVLMTLDEISDEEDVQDSAAGQQASAAPEILAKDQLLTLDEVNEEDEEHTTPTEPTKEPETTLLTDTKDTEVKKEEDDKEQEGKPQPEVQQDALANKDQGDHTEQPLLTLDEVKADEEEMSFADIEHQFLTVDEIGEEEEESEDKTKDRDPEPDVKSNALETMETIKTEASPAAKRGRPQKRPLPDSTETSEDSPQKEMSKGAAPKKAPANNKAPKGSEPGTADIVQDTTEPPADKPEAADGKSETPAKKTKLEASPAEKATKLAPFNSSTPVGLEFLVPKTGYFCELCSLFYMDDSSKLKHCRSLRHYQAVEKHLAKLEAGSAGKSS